MLNFTPSPMKKTIVLEFIEVQHAVALDDLDLRPIQIGYGSASPDETRKCQRHVYYKTRNHDRERQLGD